MKSMIKKFLLMIIGMVKQCHILKELIKRIVINVPFLKRVYVRLAGQPQSSVIPQSRAELSAEAEYFYELIKNGRS